MKEDAAQREDHVQSAAAKVKILSRKGSCLSVSVAGVPEGQGFRAMVLASWSEMECAVEVGVVTVAKSRRPSS